VPETTIKNRSEEKKITINAFMISISGKVSAGNAILNLLGKELNSTIENVQFLEKCPDKGAKIYYSYSIEVFRSRSERLDKTLISELKLNDRRETDNSDAKKKGNTFSSMQLPEKLRLSFEDKYFKYPTKSPDRIISTSHINLTESKVEQVIPISKHIT
jgi:hypothetical protein